MATNGTPSREAALKRSRRILKRAVRTFRALPSVAARAAIEHAIDAVQRADQLAEDPADAGQAPGVGPPRPR